MTLTDLQIKAAKPTEKDYRLYDTGGLYLQVTKTGSRLWRLKYRFNGKEKLASLGKWPDVSLKEARIKRNSFKEELATGSNPIKKRLPRTNSFSELAREWFKVKGNAWIDSYKRTITIRLNKYILPSLGEMQPDAIVPQDVLVILREIEKKGAVETTHRVLAICSQIFRFGVASGICPFDPCRDLKGALTPYKSKEYAAITDKEGVKLLMQAIDAYQGTPIVRYALKFSALTFCRPTEIRHAEWTEIDFENRLWTIPALKMKMKKEHLVPLSRQAIEVLNGIKVFTGSGKYVFPSPRSSTRPLSENGVIAALVQMGYKTKMTAHGFRSMASTRLNEEGYKHDVIEAQLAHSGYDKIRAIYNRAEYMEERYHLMQAWADYLDNLCLD